MKFRLLFFMVLAFAMLAPVPQTKAANPWAAIIKAAIRRVVRAVDLLIQRRQNAVIKLQNAQKALENAMAKLKLDQIEDWVRKQRDLYQAYYQELRKVKEVIAYYFKVKQIAQQQERILEQYQKAWGMLSSSTHFTASELLYMQSVYTGLLDQTAKTTDMLTLAIGSDLTQMSDAQRLALINQAAESTQQLYEDLTRFTEQNMLLALSRGNSTDDNGMIRQLYGLP
ncbi:hypothetical protein SAMN04487995_0377 [Dyadobacter koreensis]|uniref:Conjugal transfer protein TraI n=1 Tax=Dyadobacter koreensis TaxID=408657 RepID=A0A1H6Q7F2_9BACT|nr:conjugal transfer protein TraI [Dyadobacter koreensis]SEI39693.1 hypothetical protein SAMN04487995_0377 [Dyadobacter koreensis]